MYFLFVALIPQNRASVEPVLSTTCRYRCHTLIVASSKSVLTFKSKILGWKLDLLGERKLSLPMSLVNELRIHSYMTLYCQ